MTGCAQCRELQGICDGQRVLLERATTRLGEMSALLVANTALLDRLSSNTLGTLTPKPAPWWKFWEYL